MRKKSYLVLAFIMCVLFISSVSAYVPALAKSADPIQPLSYRDEVISTWDRYVCNYTSAHDRPQYNVKYRTLVFPNSYSYSDTYTTTAKNAYCDKNHTGTEYHYTRHYTTW